MAEQIYFTDGRYYQCVSATNAGESPTVAGAKWLEIEVPKEWRRVLAQLTYENLLKMGGQTDKEEMETPMGETMLDELVRVNAMRETWRDRPVVNR